MHSHYSARKTVHKKKKSLDKNGICLVVILLFKAVCSKKAMSCTHFSKSAVIVITKHLQHVTVVA